MSKRNLALILIIKAFRESMNKTTNTKHGNQCVFYNDSIIKDSKLGNHCIIGNFSRVYDSDLSDNIRIDRNNLILNSKMGNQSYTGQFTTIMHSTIEKFCSISWGVTIGGGEHDYKKITTHDFLYNTNNHLNNGVVGYQRFSKATEIGNDVWIGTNSTICRGVCIGDGAVIGANSVVTKNVPPYAIVAGCPARIVKYRFNNTIIERLLNLRWWDFPDNKIKENFSLFLENDIEKILCKFEKACK